MRTITTEAQEQKALFEWAEWAKRRHPELALMYHIPNEARRSYALGKEMKAQGLRSGVPDICLPVPRGGYGALYIEMKRRQDSRLSDNQRGWINGLNRAGNRAVVCKGWEEARNEIMKYLKGE
jgi:hypothetical protein